MPPRSTTLSKNDPRRYFHVYEPYLIIRMAPCPWRKSLACLDPISQLDIERRGRAEFLSHSYFPQQNHTKVKNWKMHLLPKILQPLMDFGLVHLKPAPHSKQELHLVVHSSPIQSDNHETKEPVEVNEPWIQETVPTESSPIEKLEGSASNPSLPPAIKQAISQDPQLMKRKPGIFKAFKECNRHPRYSEQGFLRKMLGCIKYRHGNFGSYLLRSILNEWDKSIPVRRTAPSMTLL